MCINLILKSLNEIMQHVPVAAIIKLGQIKKGTPLDKNEYGFRIFISRGVGGLRGVKVAEKRRYYDDWWNGRKSGNPDLELAPSKGLGGTRKYIAVLNTERVDL